MNTVEFSDEENYVVMAETFTGSLADLNDKTRQVNVLKEIHKLLDSHTPARYIYEDIEGCDELQNLRVSDDIRVFCRLVMGIPQGNKEYNILYVFYVDPHEYRGEQLERFDDAAKERLEEATSFDYVGDVDEYLAEMDAFDAADIKQRIDRA